mmetsp:Transcript_31167/g.85396  ORF Transcript_31167/g.85396 Transcript_31167/m.85396 type:complete len:213 (+) Transcript_31167:3141-3779(+)
MRSAIFFIRSKSATSPVMAFASVRFGVFVLLVICFSIMPSRQGGGVVKSPGEDVVETSCGIEIGVPLEEDSVTFDVSAAFCAWAGFSVAPVFGVTPAPWALPRLASGVADACLGWPPFVAPAASGLASAPATSCGEAWRGKKSHAASGSADESGTFSSTSSPSESLGWLLPRSIPLAAASGRNSSTSSRTSADGGSASLVENSQHAGLLGAS